MLLKNKVALVTGASRGIGHATALLLAKEGATVIVNYITQENQANEVVNTITNNGGQAIAIKCDISEESEVKKMINTIVKEFGRIDILVNNAGIVIDLPFKERTLEHWKKTFGVNLFGMFLCCKYAQPHMKTGSRIVNISSTNGIDSYNPESIDYDSSKAGVILLTKNLAKEFAPDILVNSVAPGWINTEMNALLPKKFVEEETEKISLKRFAKPEEIAKTILFLVTEATFMTGAVLIADGGR